MDNILRQVACYVQFIMQYYTFAYEFLYSTAAAYTYDMYLFFDAISR